MPCIRRFVFVLVVIGAVIELAAAEPRVPAEAFVTPADVAITAFATEPLLSSPADIDVDASGRVWVCEVMNYRSKKATRAAGDRILVLEDSNGDGVADRQTVFHQGSDVDSALGICVIGEGAGRKVIVSCAPDVFVFHDDDGDLKADRKESLFTKIGQPQHDHSVHALVVGPDGRWYFNFGNTGRAVHDKDGKPVTDRSGNVVNDSGRPYRQGMVFRCRPDGGDFEVLGHNFRNNYEVAVDSFGTLWQSDNDDDGNRGVRINWVMEYGNYGYVDERTGAGWQAWRTNLEPEVPLRHWHQNDPGVVPNLLLTGAGSPTGMCVYEGSLLPARFHGALIHCDAGPNVVRAYHVRPQGAGYAAETEQLVDGSSDKWFRPSDVCVAPDGSLIVADWHDPGVGGHGMDDTQKGRIYRIAAPGATWSMPKADFSSVSGAIAALASPNLCTRATALERLAREPEKAAAAIDVAATKAVDPRHAARLAWARGMLPGRSTAEVEALIAADDPQMRMVGLRMCRLTNGDVLAAVEKLVADPTPAVRREAAIALRGMGGERADRAWAALAADHEAGDRWAVEALGIGADSLRGVGDPGQWDGRLAAWLTQAGDGWKSPAGREIVWRSRGTETPRLLCDLIGEPSIGAAESLVLLRGLDFQDQPRVREAVRGLVKTFTATDEKLRIVLPELVMRLEATDAADAAIAARATEAAGYVAGSQRFVDLVQRFRLLDLRDQLLALAASETTSAQLAASAVGVAVSLGADIPVAKLAAAGDPAGLRLMKALGVNGGQKAIGILKAAAVDAAVAPAERAAAIRSLGLSNQGAKELVAMAKQGGLTGSLPQVAAVAIANCPWGDIRQAAADVLPMPKVKGGRLPPMTELVKRSGDPARGKAVFVGAGTCSKCHIVGGEGKAVGPDLSGIGAKLSKPALYESILAPSAAISHNYETHTALLDDGRSLTGVLISQSADTIVIRGADGIDQTIPVGEIEELIKQPVSLMPSDLTATLSSDELVDLVAWLETLKQTN